MKISRSKLELFLNCPRCFYLDRRLGIPQPPSFPFSLNSAVDALLKKEFDVYRRAGTPHPLMTAHHIDAVPFAHANIEQWRDSLRRGISYRLSDIDVLAHGGIDDVWINSNDELSIVDYKSTAKTGEVTLDAPWQVSYKRQMEIYQWLFRKNGFSVSPIGYFVYCNGNVAKDTFSAMLEFSIKILPYHGDDSWVEASIRDAHACFLADALPSASATCNFCSYRRKAAQYEG